LDRHDPERDVCLDRHDPERDVLDGKAAFDDGRLCFDLVTVPLATVRPGRYHLISKSQENVMGEFLCAGTRGGTATIPPDIASRLDRESQRHAKATISRSLETNNRHFQEARERLERWADDMVLATEKELKDTKEQIKALSRQASMAATVEEQCQIQSDIQELEKTKRRQRQ